MKFLPSVEAGVIMSCFKHLEAEVWKLIWRSSWRRFLLRVLVVPRSQDWKWMSYFDPFVQMLSQQAPRGKRHGQAESVVARTWCCPICEEKFDLENRQKASLKLGHHIRSKHTALWRKQFWRKPSLEGGISWTWSQGNGAAHSLQVHQEGGPIARCWIPVSFLQTFFCRSSLRRPAPKWATGKGTFVGSARFFIWKLNARAIMMGRLISGSICQLPGRNSSHSMTPNSRVSMWRFPKWSWKLESKLRLTTAMNRFASI